jgi:hypothetical protein
MNDRDGGLGGGKQSVVITKPAPAAKGRLISKHPMGTGGGSTPTGSKAKPPVHQDPRRGGRRPPLRRYERRIEKRSTNLSQLPPPPPGYGGGRDVGGGGGGKPMYRMAQQEPYGGGVSDWIMGALEDVNTLARRTMRTMPQVFPGGTFDPRVEPQRVPPLDEVMGRGAYPPWFTTSPEYKQTYSTVLNELTRRR